MSVSVRFSVNGRDGSVQFTDGLRAITGYFEFGGNDVVAMIGMGTSQDWERPHPWAMAQRAAILRFIADEAIRQHARNCVADIDDARGDIVLRKGARVLDTMSSSQAANAEVFASRYQDLRAKLAGVVAAIALVLAALFWIGQRTLSVGRAHGTPLNESVRYAGKDSMAAVGIATLIQTIDTHLPRWSGRGGEDTVAISVVLTPIGDSTSHRIALVDGLSPNQIGLSRILGGDGQTVWVDALGLYGVRVRDNRVVTTDDLRAANPQLDAAWWDDTRGMDVIGTRLHIVSRDRSAAINVDPETLKATPSTPKSANARRLSSAPERFLAAGLLVAPTRWLGLHSSGELGDEFRPGRWIRPIESADPTRELRRLCAASLEADSSGSRFKILSIEAQVGDEFLNAAFLRSDEMSSPLRLTDPDSALMIYTSAPGLAGTLVVARVDLQGALLWRIDTGLDRYALRQIIPGEDVFAFVGTRQAVAGKLSEPLLVLVDNASGEMKQHSLWR